MKAAKLITTLLVILVLLLGCGVPEEKQESFCKDISYMPVKDQPGYCLKYLEEKSTEVER